MRTDIYTRGFNRHLVNRNFKMDAPPVARTNFSEGVDVSKINSGTPEFKHATIGMKIISVKPGENIQKALDAIHDNGGGKVYLQVGTHYVNSDLIVYSDTVIEGEAGYGTIIDFGGGAYSLKIEGTDVYTTGTLAGTNGDAIVTGTDTAWTSDMVGLSMLLDGDWYEIKSVNSATEIELAWGFLGATDSGYTYVICDRIKGVIVRFLTIQNSSTSAVSIRYAEIIVLDLFGIFSAAYGVNSQDCVGIELYDGEIGLCEVGWYQNNSWSYLFDTSYIYDCTTYGMDFGVGGDATMINFGVSGCVNSAIRMNGTEKLGMISFTIDNCDYGIEMVADCVENTIVVGGILQNINDGILLTASSSRNIFSQLTPIKDNGGYGINIAGADCTENLILGNIFGANPSGSLNDSGTDNLIASNIGLPDGGTASSYSPSVSPSVSVSRSPSISPSAS